MSQLIQTEPTTAGFTTRQSDQSSMGADHFDGFAAPGLKMSFSVITIKLVNTHMHVNSLKDFY